jgi:hypothetical protein
LQTYALRPDKLEQTDILVKDIFVEKEGYGMNEFSNFKENDHHIHNAVHYLPST